MTLEEGKFQGKKGEKEKDNATLCQGKRGGGIQYDGKKRDSLGEKWGVWGERAGGNPGEGGERSLSFSTEKKYRSDLREKKSKPSRAVGEAKK